MKNVMELNEADFESQLKQATLPVVVDFYATWCGPCKMLAPILEQLAAEFQGRIQFAKVNVDEAPTSAATHQITGVPTLMLFQGGKAVDRLVGMVPAKTLRTWLEKAAGAAVTTQSR
jgi:thioredoxin